MNQNDYKEAFLSVFSERIPEEKLLSTLNEKLRPYAGYIPKRLYRYRSFSEYSLRELLLQNVFLARPDSFDDVFDSQYIYLESPTIPYLKSEEEFARDMIIDNLQDRLVMDRNAYYQNVLRISCFTTDCENVPMWYYYANKHKGLCFEYDISDLPPYEDVEYCFLPVIYPDKKEENVFRKIGEKTAPDAVRNALIKNKDWNFEKEWRMIRVSEKKEKEYASVKITKVIAGCDASFESIGLLANLINKNGLDVKLSFMRMTTKGMKETKVNLKGVLDGVSEKANV